MRISGPNRAKNVRISSEGSGLGWEGSVAPRKVLKIAEKEQKINGQIIGHTPSTVGTFRKKFRKYGWDPPSPIIQGS